MASKSAADTLDFWKVQPEVPSVIILAEYDFTIAPSDGVAKLVAIATLLENRSCDPEIGDTA
jgi:hypothetical protein